MSPGAAADLVLLTRSLGYGGAEAQLVRLALGLHARGYRVQVLVFYGGGPLEERLAAAGVPVLALGKRSRWDLLFFFARLRRCVRRLRPRVLYSFLGSSNVFAALLRPGVPQTRVVWSVRSSNVDLGRYGRVDRWQFRIEAWLSRIPHRIVVNSRAGLEHAARHGFHRAGMRVVYNGIDTALFRRDEEKRRAMRRAWGIPEGQRLIGLVGRLDPMKGHAVFLRAAAGLVQGGQPVHFVCVGDGSAGFSNQLRRLCAALGIAAKVDWRAAQGDAAAVFNALDVCTSASLSEGFSNVIGEAMACEVPCVVTDVGDSAHIVGDAGIVIPPADPAALTAAWQQLLAAPPAALRERGARARARILAEFPLEKMITASIAALELGAPAAARTP